MSLNQLHIILFGMLISQFVLADVPVEVIGSCKNSRAVNASVTYTKIIPPAGVDDSPGCTNHIESTEGSFNYGAITCNHENYLILKSDRINLNTAQNHSVNPSITPGNRVTQLSDWSKIVFDNNEYLCIDVELSQSGEGADVSQYYIVENAFNTSTPVLHYYFFNKDIMPMTDAN
ncbi:TPA: hypothetical protein ACJT8G_002867 [Legionella pneumophila]|uniref:hypothetical protein n=1 Tax=Legionella pneumophila TaxID=446 RepID=UPI0007776EDD|nr:hypothetical protein [Legionella pneumophila]